MANEIYNSSWWGVGACNGIGWGIVYKPYAGCETLFESRYISRVAASGGTTEATSCITNLGLDVYDWEYYFRVMDDGTEKVVNGDFANGSDNAASGEGANVVTIAMAPTLYDDDNGTDSNDDNEIDSADEMDDEDEDDETMGEARERDPRLRQAIRAKVEAGFSEQAQSQLRERFNNMSDDAKDELKAKLGEMKEEFKQNRQEFKNEVQANREEVHAAVDALKLAGNFTGTDIADIMTDYNAELKEILKSENQIQNRSKVARFFAGGDEKAAERLEVQNARNEERIEEVRVRLAEVEDEELKVVLEGHLAALEKNQERLGAVAEDEMNSKGLFGWIWK